MTQHGIIPVLRGERDIREPLPLIQRLFRRRNGRFDRILRERGLPRAREQQGQRGGQPPVPYASASDHPVSPDLSIQIAKTVSFSDNPVNLSNYGPGAACYD